MRIDQRYLFVGFFLLCLAVISLYSFRAQRKSLAEAQNSAKQQFQQLHVSAPNARYALVGSSAKIVRTEETGGVNGLFTRGNSYVLAVYAQNEAGEYFMFRSSSSKPYIKHLSHELARQVLGQKYQAPVKTDG